MNTVRDILRDADPLLHESHGHEGRRDRVRQVVVAAAVGAASPRSEWFRTPIAIVAAVALTVVGIAVVGSQIWSLGRATLQAAVRFEVRLAEDRPGPGLREVRTAGSDRRIYLHEEIVVTNDDIAGSSIVPGNGPSRFDISVQFNAAGAQKIRQATAGHVGRPVAILIDGVVVMAPVVRSPIDASALITGDYTQAEAERIVNGIGVR